MADSGLRERLNRETSPEPNAAEPDMQTAPAQVDMKGQTTPVSPSSPVQVAKADPVASSSKSLYRKGVEPESLGDAVVQTKSEAEPLSPTTFNRAMEITPFRTPPANTPVTEKPQRFVARSFSLCGRGGNTQPPRWPKTIGPFKLQRLNTIKSDDVRIDFDKCTWTLTASVHHSHALKKRKGLMGRLSCFSPVTMSRIAAKQNGIPEDARYYAFCYPAVHEPKGDSFDQDLTFVRLGGFVYLDQEFHICQHGLMTLKLGEASGQMRFAEGVEMKQGSEELEELLARNSMHSVTVEGLLEVGATHFCWIPPSVEDGQIVLGRFLYLCTQ